MIDDEIYKIALSVLVREATRMMAGEFITSDEYTLAKWVLEQSKRPSHRGSNLIKENESKKIWKKAE